MRLTYQGRRHAWYVATGDDARTDTDEAQGSVPTCADLTVSSSDAAQPYTYPEDQLRATWRQSDPPSHRTGFTT